MSVFMLHFGCLPAGATPQQAEKTADVCVISKTLEQAEEMAREVIAGDGNEPGSLIAYSTVDKVDISHLGSEESLLYLRALKQNPQVAVFYH